MEGVGRRKREGEEKKLMNERSFFEYEKKMSFFVSVSHSLSLSLKDPKNSKPKLTDAGLGVAPVG
jgi:hypothetical protein